MLGQKLGLACWYLVEAASFNKSTQSTLGPVVPFAMFAMFLMFVNYSMQFMLIIRSAQTKHCFGRAEARA